MQHWPILMKRETAAKCCVMSVTEFERAIASGDLPSPRIVNGKPWSEDGIRKRLQKWAARRGYKVVPHGLRKNAVNTLLEVGCTVAEVSSITGQSLQMVEHYAKQINKRRLAKSAIGRWENNS